MGFRPILWEQKAQHPNGAVQAPEMLGSPSPSCFQGSQGGNHREEGSSQTDVLGAAGTVFMMSLEAAMKTPLLS